ncbi:MAG TPA: hypothetical protein VEA80_01840 [Vitreimonas sp.]|uniref:hypothetical protein n=1 Tax=Vitreimonas sp. TaxID=3069702 RepID=UPI002D4ADC13|nr:hypothetical protein [Vitreimonas sp.]HYD86192.1 hypothetical protein [Vitreimonas sp.]
MRSLVLAASLILAASGAAHAQTIDPVARAREGVIECLGPDRVARTCAAISNYRVLEGGEIANDAAVHIQNDPTVIMYGTSTLYVRDGMLCERVLRSTIDAARITIDGQPAPEDVAQSIRAAFWKALAGVTEICSRYTADGDGAAVAIYFDGVVQPELADRAIWVRPEDGYTIGAADASPA